MVDRAFYDGTDLIKSVPFLRVPLDPGKSAEVHVFISIGSAPLFRSTAWIVTAADILPFHHVDFWTAPFFAVGPAFFMAMPEMFHGEGRVVWTGGITVKVISDFRQGTFVTDVIRDQSFGKMEFLFQEAIGFDGVKSRIPEEGIRRKLGMKGKVVGQDRMKGGGVPDGLVLVRRIRFLIYRHLRMSFFKIIVQEGDMPYDPETVCKDREFIGIAEMAVDVLLFGIGTGGCPGGH